MVIFAVHIIHKKTIQEEMTSVGIIKLFFQMVLVWNTVLFLPLVLFLSYFDWSRKILSRVYKSSGLPDTYKSARDLVKLTWKWFVLRYRLRQFEFGYAVLKENGRYLDKVDHNVFTFQLYDYLARKFLYLQSLTNKSVLEVQCGSRHGIQYVARNLNAARCIAVNPKEKLIRRLTDDNTTLKVVYKKSSIEELPALSESDLGKFDCILAITALGGDNVRDKLKVLRRLLNKQGYICIAECIQDQDIKAFQALIQNSGLTIVKSQNLTKNVLHAIKLDTRKTHSDTNLLEKLWMSFLNFFSQPVSGIVSDLQERCKFIAYIVEAATE